MRPNGVYFDYGACSQGFESTDKGCFVLWKLKIWVERTGIAVFVLSITRMSDTSVWWILRLAEFAQGDMETYDDRGRGLEDR